MRSFLILARHAAQTVFDESVEYLRMHGALLWPPGNAKEFACAWADFSRVRLKLAMYEWYLYARGLLGITNDLPDSAISG